MRLLYENGQGEIWFSKGEEFAKGIIHRYQDQGKDKGAYKELTIYTNHTQLYFRQDLTKRKIKTT